MLWNAVAVGLIVGFIIAVINLTAHLVAEFFEPVDDDVAAKYRWMFQAFRKSGIYTALLLVLLATSFAAWFNGINGFWSYLAALFISALIWAVHWVIFHFGMNRGVIYWKTQIKQFYAYGTVLLISFGFTGLIATLTLLTSNAGNHSFYQIIQSSFDAIISFSISGALGTWLEHRHRNNLKIEPKQSS